MSSHHFVREGQEPALFIMQPLPLTLLQPLLEWAPLILVADAAVEEALMWRIKLDIVVGKAESLEPFQKALDEQGPVEIIVSDEEPLLVVIDLLAKRGQRGVNISTMDLSDRLLTQALSMLASMVVVLITPEMKWSAFSEEFGKWLPRKTVLMIKGHSEISFTNAQQTEPGMLITDEDGVVTIKSTIPFWVGEFLT